MQFNVHVHDCKLLLLPKCRAQINYEINYEINAHPFQFKGMNNDTNGLVNMNDDVTV